jgi:TP901-1 family phage major tail protein
MEHFKGEERILYIKISGEYFPIGCLSENSFSESSETIDTTTRDNAGWITSRPTMQSYNISFSGIQVNSTIAGGDLNVASYDRLKELKRDRQLLDWKIQGTNFPIVDYGKAYITDISESAPVGELITFSATLNGYGKPLMASIELVLLNNGNPNAIIQDGNSNLIQV